MTLSTTTTTSANAALIRRAYQAFAAGDIPTVLSLLADDISWHVPGRSPLSGRLHRPLPHPGLLRPLPRLLRWNAAGRPARIPRRWRASRRVVHRVRAATRSGLVVARGARLAHGQRARDRLRRIPGRPARNFGRVLDGVTDVEVGVGSGLTGCARTWSNRRVRGGYDHVQQAAELVGAQSVAALPSGRSVNRARMSPVATSWTIGSAVSVGPSSQSARDVARRWCPLGRWLSVVRLGQHRLTPLLDQPKRAVDHGWRPIDDTSGGSPASRRVSAASFARWPSRPRQPRSRI